MLCMCAWSRSRAQATGAYDKIAYLHTIKDFTSNIFLRYFFDVSCICVVCVEWPADTNEDSGIVVCVIYTLQVDVTMLNQQFGMPVFWQ